MIAIHRDPSFHIFLKEKLEHSSIAAEDRCREIQILSQLSHPSDCELGTTLTTQDIDERIRVLKDRKRPKPKNRLDR